MCGRWPRRRRRWPRRRGRREWTAWPCRGRCRRVRRRRRADTERSFAVTADLAGWKACRWRGPSAVAPLSVNGRDESSRQHDVLALHGHEPWQRKGDGVSAWAEIDDPVLALIV